MCVFFYVAYQGFMEIHSPKLLAGASEGGAEVFMTDYFGQPACLAQSPQLYKQMTAACGGFGRVMEVGLLLFCMEACLPIASDEKEAASFAGACWGKARPA